MSGISAKDRLIKVLNKEKIDRPPVISPGGMMNAVTVEVMNKTGHTLPEGHHEAGLMVELAQDIQSHTGFENFGIPFCMTVEAEVLGSDINFGSLSCEPKIQKERFPSAAEVVHKDLDTLLKSGRIEAVIKAGRQLSQLRPDIPVIGNLTGPLSTAASIVDPMRFLKDLRKDKENAHKTLEYVTGFLIGYARLMVDNGAAVISIEDPTATGEILGPAIFEEYAVKYLNKLIEGINGAQVPIIVHICGKINPVKHLLPQIKAHAISTDAMVNLRLLKEEYPQLTTMGNLSTVLIEFGTPEKVSAQTERLIRDGIDIIAPACGLSTSSPLENIQAMTGAVKGSKL